MPVLNKHRDGMPAGSIYIGRGSRWGNPFLIGPDIDRKKAISLYRELLWHNICYGRVSLPDLAALHQKNLVCYCAPQPCHGDVLVRAAAWAVRKTG